MLHSKSVGEKRTDEKKSGERVITGPCTDWPQAGVTSWLAGGKDGTKRTCSSSGWMDCRRDVGVTPGLSLVRSIRWVARWPGLGWPARHSTLRISLPFSAFFTHRPILSFLRARLMWRQLPFPYLRRVTVPTRPGSGRRGGRDAISAPLVRTLLYSTSHRVAFRCPHCRQTPDSAGRSRVNCRCRRDER